MNIIEAKVEYRLIAGFPGYRVGSDGSVWCCLKRIGKGVGNGRGSMSVISSEWRKLKLNPRRRGYLFVTLQDRGVLKTVAVHKIVLEAFVGPKPPNMQACHDPDPTTSNNRLENLRWGTPKDNRADLLRYHHSRGHHASKARLTVDQVREIRQLRRGGLSYESLCERFGVSMSTIGDIVTRKNWAWLQD